MSNGTLSLCFLSFLCFQRLLQRTVDYVNAVSLIQIFLGLTLPNISKLECFVDVMINIDSKFREAIKNNGTLYVAKVKRKVQLKKKNWPICYN